MTLKTLLLGAGLVLVTAFVTHTVSSQDAEALAKDSHMGMSADEMAAWMAANQPGEHHRELAKATGKWKVDQKFWMAPGAPPMEAEMSSTMSMIMDGRYMQEDFRGDMMGMPFVGRLILGYNNVTEEYESIWIDNMATGMSTATGNMNESGELHLSGIMKDMQTPEGRPFRMVTKYIDDDHVVFEMYDTSPDGSEYMVMENAYSRR